MKWENKNNVNILQELNYKILNLWICLASGIGEAHYQMEEEAKKEEESIMGEDQYPFTYRQQGEAGCTCFEDESKSSITSDADLTELAKVTGKAPKRDYRQMKSTPSTEIVKVYI